MNNRNFYIHQKIEKKNVRILQQYIHLRLSGGGGPPDIKERASIASGGLIKQKIYARQHAVFEYTRTYEEIVINLCTDLDSGEYINKKIAMVCIE